MIYVDAKFASMLAPRVRNFKQQKDYLWNFSCPLCGDSKKNQSKARGYIYRKESSLFYKCHNCQAGTSLGNLLKQVDQRMYNEYTLEKFGSTNNKHVNDKPDLEIFKTDTIPVKKLNANPVSELADNHPIKQFLLLRHINQDLHEHFYWVAQFKHWVNENIAMNFHNIKKDEPRLVIPFYNEENELIAIQGRAFGNETPKYYTLKTNEKNHKVYGLDRVDPTKWVYVTEGPIDSLFLDNAIAVAGADFYLAQVRQFKDNCTIVFDNEPRNPALVKQVEKMIKHGFHVCLWNDSIKEKDINDMIMSGMTKEELKTIIENNTYQGNMALLKFTTWSKRNV